MTAAAAKYAKARRALAVKAARDRARQHAAARCGTRQQQRRYKAVRRARRYCAALRCRARREKRAEATAVSCCCGRVVRAAQTQWHARYATPPRRAARRCTEHSSKYMTSGRQVRTQGRQVTVRSYAAETYSVARARTAICAALGDGAAAERREARRTSVMRAYAGGGV